MNELAKKIKADPIFADWIGVGFKPVWAIVFAANSNEDDIGF